MADRYQLIHFGTRCQEPTACGLFACGLTSEDGKLAGARWSNCWGWDADARGCPRAEASPDKRVTCLDCLKLMPTVIDRDIKPENVVPPLPKGEPAPLPCPWCDTPGEPTDLAGLTDPVLWFVACDAAKCPLRPSTEYADTAAEALAAWNTRPREAHLIAEGRRQATAATVALGRETCAGLLERGSNPPPGGMTRDAYFDAETILRAFIDVIEQGDHLTGQGDGGSGG